MSARALQLFIMCAVLALTGCTEARRPNLNKTGSARSEPAAPSGAAFVRAQYPYSIVAGGVYTPEELVRARRTDRVVREHYQEFGENPEFKRVSEDMLVYVSYRKRDRVYWTRKRHVVKRGETILVDGGRMARARCGNQLSAKPQAPVENLDEPEEDVLGVPEVPKTLQAVSGTSLPDLPEVASYVPPSGFSDVPMIATPRNGGTVEIPAGAPPASSGSLPSFPNAFSRVASPASAAVDKPGTAATPGANGQFPVTNETPGGGGGNAPPSGPPTAGVPSFEPPFVPPRPPLALVPEPNISKSMWLILLGGLAVLGIRKSAGTR